VAATWSEADIPDLTGRTAVVTGASGGIGLEVARGLATKGAHVVLAVRRSERGEAAASAIRATSPRASLEVIALDLADLTSVRRFAEAFGSRVDALDLLINNAGVASVAAAHGGWLRVGFRDKSPGPLRADRPRAAGHDRVAEGSRRHRDKPGP
jgi:NAD(P)-dependent dehydrogenase (short-subunit alcohol dehydrogenase family)